MNTEHILDLYMKSIRIDGEPTESMRIVPNWSKFAEFIIRECAEVAGKDWDTAATAIYKHFDME